VQSLVLFAETGLLIGFFLPGDSPLFTAGILSATATTNPAHLPLAPVMVAAAVLGAHTGYVIGSRGGQALAVPLGTFTRWQVLGGLVWTVEKVQRSPSRIRLPRPAAMQ
jgi:membrane protein DedA with SNARE-associated domain